MNAPSVFEFYDALSRRRALTDNESLMLEKAIQAMDSAPPTKPVRYIVPHSGPRDTSGWSPAQIDSFFEIIANGKSVRTAARHVGKTDRAGVMFFHRHRVSLGAQGQ